MTVTMEDIARRTGVSQVTVSRALNNRSRISKETKQRILKEARRLNYRPNAVAAALAKKRTLSLGLVIPDITNPFVAEVTKHIESTATENDYSLVVYITNNDLEKEDASIRSLMERRVDGIIINHSRSNTPIQAIMDLKKEGFPFVLTGVMEGIETDYVMIDLAEGAYQATRHLAGLGHKRIAFLTVDYGHFKQDGYKKALGEGGIDFDESLVIRCRPGLVGIEEAIGKVLAMQDRPTAIFGLNDFQVLRAMEVLDNLGLAVPQDMALIGFDDVMFASHLKVPLTTIAQPMEQIGKMSVEILLKKIEKPTHPPWQVMLKPQLVVRESCGEKLR
ncbi:MAG: LacI family transcriptional regulator [Phycisphaerae bacterium]|nr:LacI family transcriptional regulator [Phycisphaerae bacterium]